MVIGGGSTGVLREEADATPPGDIRKCLVAFAKDPSDPLVRALKYRFAVARDHALGNLLLTALEDATGSFPEAIAICERLVNAQGHVYPSTLDHVILPPALQDFIRLRVTYPEASLKELGERANPPLSKSAVNYRVRRIESMAAEIPE